MMESKALEQRLHERAMLKDALDAYEGNCLNTLKHLPDLEGTPQWEEVAVRALRCALNAADASQELGMRLHVRCWQAVAYDIGQHITLGALVDRSELALRELRGLYTRTVEAGHAVRGGN